MNDLSEQESQQVFRADIVYASAQAMAYCFLRDRSLYFSHERIMPPLNFVVVDEADAILIDQAKNPLVLAGDVEWIMPEFREVDAFVRALELDQEYRIGKYQRNIYLTDAGYSKLDHYLDELNISDKLRSSSTTSIF